MGIIAMVDHQWAPSMPVMLGMNAPVVTKQLVQMDILQTTLVLHHVTYVQLAIIVSMVTMLTHAPQEITALRELMKFSINVHLVCPFWWQSWNRSS